MLVKDEENLRRIKMGKLGHVTPINCGVILSIRAEERVVVRRVGGPGRNGGSS